MMMLKARTDGCPIRMNLLIIRSLSAGGVALAIKLVVSSLSSSFTALDGPALPEPDSSILIDC